jgi:hypothetical protein
MLSAVTNREFRSREEPKSHSTMWSSSDSSTFSGYRGKRKREQKQTEINIHSKDMMDNPYLEVKVHDLERKERKAH